MESKKTDKKDKAGKKKKPKKLTHLKDDPEYHQLEVKLTGDERREMGVKLANITNNIHTEEDRHASVRQELKAKLAELVARQTALAAMVGRGAETREVQVQGEYFFTDGVYRVTRLDTGEMILERPIRAEERQMAIL